jgi:hypothetical protein
MKIGKMMAAAYALLLFIAYRTEPAAAQGNWSKLHVSSIEGRIACDENGWLVNVTNGSLGVSSDGGVTWRTEPIPYTYWINDVVYCGKDTIVMDYHDLGVLTSTNGGRDFTLESDGLLDGNPVYNAYPSLAANPRNTRELILCQNGIFRSSDLGATWRKTDFDVPYPYHSVFAYSRFDPDDLYCMSFSRDWISYRKSSDHGNTWKECHTAAFSEADDIDVMSDTLVVAGEYFSTDRGTTWRMMETPPPTGRNIVYYAGENCGYAYDRGENAIYAINRSVGLLRKAPGDDTLRTTTLSSTAYKSNPRSGRDIATDPRRGGFYAMVLDSLYYVHGDTIESLTGHIASGHIGGFIETVGAHAASYAATSCSIVKSDDGGAHWRSLDVVLGCGDMPTFMLASERHENVLHVSAPYEIPFLLVNDKKKLITFDGNLLCRYAAIRHDPFDPKMIYQCGYSFRRFNEDDMLASSDNDTVKAEVWCANPPKPFAELLTFDPHEKGRIYVAYMENTKSSLLYTTGDYGKTWAAVDGGGFRGTPVDLIVNPADARILIFATTTGVFRSTNAGISWVEASFGNEVGMITSIAVDSTNPDRLVVGRLCSSPYESIHGTHSYGGVFYSVDNGITWGKMSEAGLSCTNVTKILFGRKKDQLIVCTTSDAYAGTFPAVNQTPAIEARHSLTTYPNPFNSYCLVSLDAVGRTPIRAAVYDLLGRLRCEQRAQPHQSGRTELILDTEVIPHGVYELVVTCGSSSEHRLICK